MEKTIPNALEQIENPILIILLAVLMVAVVALWFRDQANRKQLVETLMANIGAVKDVNARLTVMDEHLERIISSQDKKA